MSEPLGLGMRGGLGAANAPARPRTTAGNEAWASTKAPVGLKLLQKMGWQDGKGLGANEDGRISHIRVSRKVAAIGVGATAADIKRGWETPGAVANGLNDVLARLSAVATPAPPPAPATTDEPQDATDATHRPATPDTPPKKLKRKNGRGFYERKRALKSVGRYSKQELAEIFGAVGGQAPGAGNALQNTPKPMPAVSDNVNEEPSPTEARGDTMQEDDESGRNDKTEEGSDGGEEAVTLTTPATDVASVAERALAERTKKDKKEAVSSLSGVSNGAVKKSKKKKKKKKKKKTSEDTDR